MAGPSKNKARNQTSGSTRGVDDADWFKLRKKRARVKNKIAKASRKRNR
jgi:hypothetical protein